LGWLKVGFEPAGGAGGAGRWLTDFRTEPAANRFGCPVGPEDAADAVRGVVKPTDMPDAVCRTTAAAAPNAARPVRRVQRARGNGPSCLDIGPSTYPYRNVPTETTARDHQPKLVVRSAACEYPEASGHDPYRTLTTPYNAEPQLSRQ
jgi:hypothetical protein